MYRYIIFDQRYLLLGGISFLDFVVKKDFWVLTCFCKEGLSYISYLRPQIYAILCFIKCFYIVFLYTNIYVAVYQGFSAQT